MLANTASTSKLVARSVLRPGLMQPMARRLYSERSMDWDRRYWHYRRGGFLKFAFGTFLLVCTARIAFPNWFEDRRFPREELYRKVVAEDGTQTFEKADWSQHWRGHCSDRNTLRADYSEFLEFKQWKNRKDQDASTH